MSKTTFNDIESPPREETTTNPNVCILQISPTAGLTAVSYKGKSQFILIVFITQLSLRNEDKS